MPENSTLTLNQKLENPKLNEILAKRAKLAPQPNEDGTLPKPEESVVKQLGELMEQFAEEFVMNSKVIVPVQLSKEPIRDGDTLKISANTEVTFAALSFKDNHFLPIFTDTEQFSKWTHEPVPYTVIMDFDNIASFMENAGVFDGIVLNAFSDNQIFPRGLILKWYEHKQIRAKGHASHVINQHTRYRLFTPAPYPMELSNKLCEVARANQNVNRIWLRGIELNDESGYLLVVDFSGDRSALFSAFGECSKPYLRDKALHIVSLTDGFGETATDKVIPIYEK